MPDFEKAATFVGGTKVHGYAGDYIFETIRKTGSFYEIETLDKWTPHLKEPKTVLDVGSNLGNHTLYWSEKWKRARIFAFEPYGPNYCNLQANIESNGLGDRVKAINLAVGEEDGCAVLKESSADNLGGTTFQMSAGNSEETFPVVSLDGFLKTEKVEKVDFLKIDTEGFEVGVLKGAKELLKTSRPIIWVEVSFKTHGEVLSILTDHRYSLADVIGFNMLFIPEERNVDQLCVDPKLLLGNMFQAAERATGHYKNYEAAKKWHRDAMKKCEQLQVQNEAVSEKLRQAQENYNTAKGWFEAAKAQKEEQFSRNQRLNEQLDAVKRELEDTIRLRGEDAEKLKDEQERNVKLEYMLHTTEEEKQKATTMIQQVLMQAQENEAVIEELVQETERLSGQLSAVSKLASEHIPAYAEDAELLDILSGYMLEHKVLKENAADLTLRFIAQGEESEQVIETLMQQVNKLQASTNYLRNENKAYREKLDKIKSVWYGRLGIQIYKFSIKLRNKLKSMLNRFKK